ncbi:MAG: single-stranded-DNA-specific exonuclease RecJ [bacterium]
MTPLRWKLKASSSKDKIEQLSKDTNLHPIVCQILLNRELENREDINAFLKPDLAQMHNPFLLKDMSVAVERVEDALKKGEEIVIYGDYDVDGITAAAILTEFLTNCGGRVRVRLPNRIKDGYGLTKKAVEKAHKEGARLIITVDCGISDHEAAGHAYKKGIDLIITDHHHSPETLPLALAIINPKQAECPYPYKHLAGVGVALKLIQALTLSRQGRQISFNQIGFWPAILNKYLDLVCLGTIADIMPLTGENRAIVKFGLEVLDQTERPGLIALREVSGIKEKKMTSGLVGFVLAPRINAAGRVHGPEEGLRLLLTKSPEEGEYLANFLNQQNLKRRQIEEKMLREAREKVDKELSMDDNMIIILSHKDWHPGVIGIVAQKLVEEFFRPAILISLDSGTGKGSARSIPHIHIYNLLMRCQNLLKDFGGHAGAAGLVIEEPMIPAFRHKANKLLKEIYIIEDLVPEMDVDAEMDPDSIDHTLINQLNTLEPFGCENPEPSLCLRGVYLAGPPRLLKDAHLKVHLKSGPFIHEAIGFNMRKIWEHIKSYPFDHIWDVIFYPQINNWRGKNQIQLMLKDIKPHDTY